MGEVLARVLPAGGILRAVLPRAVLIDASFAAGGLLWCVRVLDAMANLDGYM